ncbi:hypothetical protein JCM10213_002129 [Rhodosporidiobolus nylandii]
MDASLKQELKAWEAQFRAEYGRAATKDDIKQRPDIAAKYKTYNKAKILAGKASAPAAKSTSTAAKPSTSLPPPPPVFKTPTKPKPSRARPKETTQIDASTSHDALGAHGSPSKRASASSRGQKNAAAPSFVLANSPSKLRALAALHSASGSPNRRQGGDWDGAQLAPGLESVKQVDPVAARLSPQKAKNPFASPSKAAGVFGEFEKAEREKMRAKKAKQREKQKAGGVLGKAATSRGAGWGASALDGAGQASQRVFSRSDSLASSANGMDLDEVDDFFSSQPSRSGSQPSHFASQLARHSPQRQDADMANGDAEDDGDEVLGPSPAKPSVAASLLGLPIAASASSSAKPFKPLLAESNPFSAPPASSSQTAAPPKPKLFATSLRASLPPSSKPLLATTRGLKRAPSTSAFSLPGGKKPPQSAGNDDEDEFDDGDDSFYADAAAAADDPAAKKGKAKRARKAPQKRTVKGKGKALEIDAEDLEDGVTVLSSAREGELVLEVEHSDEEGAAGEKKRERLVVHSRGWQARQRQLDREERRRRRKEEGMDDDGEREEEDDDWDSDDLVDDVSLLSQKPRVALSRPRTSASQHSDAGAAVTCDEPSASLATSLPADLASVLSLRASPQKPKAGLSTAKERQVARLLGEPGARGRRQQGLLDLQDEGAEDDFVAEEEEQEEEDDDWDEEVDGWKATGEAMDGYYSGEEEW